MNNFEEKAKRIATEAHKTQCRKDGVTPYIVHPEAVANLLKSIGIEDDNILCAAWLHDVVEDCDLTIDFIEKEFNPEIARLVKALTRDRDFSKELYKNRIANSDFAVQIIKLADVVHNCKTLGKFLPKKTIRRFVEESDSLYFSLAKKWSNTLHRKLSRYIEPWRSWV